jgi:uncharacterized protein CbrC (UPF0167 family)
MLPSFRYHPDPVSTGSVKASENVCICCGQSRGFIYACSTHCRTNIREQLCPWCIADGSAATKYDAMFCDDHWLVKAGLAEEIITEVTRRTPGYTSWQGDEWQSCCQDACEFHGDLSREELRSLSGKALDNLLSGTGWTTADVSALSAHYQPGGSPAIYKFVCRHCREPRYYYDCD